MEDVEEISQEEDLVRLDAFRHGPQHPHFDVLILGYRHFLFTCCRGSQVEVELVVNMHVALCVSRSEMTLRKGMSKLPCAGRTFGAHLRDSPKDDVTGGMAASAKTRAQRCACNV